MGLLFFQNPIYIALTLIGASLPDFDLDVKENNVYKLIIVGLVIFGILYLINLPYFIGIMICLLAIIFYFSHHRGFTHSILGICILTTIIFLILIIGSYTLLSFNLESLSITESTAIFKSLALGESTAIFKSLSISDSIAIWEKISLGIMVLFMGILLINRRLIIPFILIFLLGLLIFKTTTLDYFMMIFSIFLGLLSHLILDSFSPSGVKILAPFSSKKYHKDFGIIMIILIGILAIYPFIQLLILF